MSRREEEEEEGFSLWGERIRDGEEREEVIQKGVSGKKNG
jgi:hypothetical protein